MVLENFLEKQREHENLRELYLNNTAIKELPTSIDNLESLWILDLHACSNLLIFLQVYKK